MKDSSMRAAVGAMEEAKRAYAIHGWNTDKLDSALSLLRAALEEGEPPAFTDERILHLWDTHVAYETGDSLRLDNKDKLAFARAVIAAASIAAEVPVALVDGAALRWPADPARGDANGR